MDTINSMTGKVFIICWSGWVRFCAEYDIDPVKNCELGFDLGGGNSYTVACYEIPDELAHLEEVQRREDIFSRRRWREW